MGMPITLACWFLRPSSGEALADVMQVAARMKLFHSQVLHFENDEPVQLEERWVNPAVAPDYAEQDFTNTTPNLYLMRAAPLQRVEYRIEAAAPAPVGREQLRMAIPVSIRRAPRGSEKVCKTWLSEAAYRMIQNNLDPEVAEHPHALVVYSGIGRAARNWECYDQILASLKDLEENETLLIQSGKPVGVFRTHKVRRACCSRTRTSCRTGRTGTISTSSTERA